MSTDKNNPIYRIIGAAMEVHSQLGPGFTEPVYQEAFAFELELKSIPFDREKTLPIIYKGKLLNKTLRPDFICFGNIIVELKAISQIGNGEMAQVIGYLKASGLEKGIIINFAEESLKFQTLAKSSSLNLRNS